MVQTFDELEEALNDIPDFDFRTYLGEGNKKRAVVEWVAAPTRMVLINVTPKGTLNLQTVDNTMSVRMRLTGHDIAKLLHAVHEEYERTH